MQARLSIPKSCPHTAGSVPLPMWQDHAVPLTVSLIAPCVPQHTHIHALDPSAPRLVATYKDITPSRLQTPGGQDACRLHPGTRLSHTGTVSWYGTCSIIVCQMEISTGFLYCAYHFSLRAQSTAQGMDVFQRLSPCLTSEALCHSEIRLPPAITYYNR